MINPIQITIREDEHNKYLSNLIRQKAEKLNQFRNDIISCHIVVEPIQNNQHQGNHHAVHIDIKIPQEDIIINRVENENVYIAIRDAINAASRRLKSNRWRKLKKYN